MRKVVALVACWAVRWVAHLAEMKAEQSADVLAAEMAASSVGKSADRTVAEMAGMWDATRAVCWVVDWVAQ